MKLALIRHAATDWNLHKRVQGRIDQPLGEVGRRQAQALRLPPRFAGYRWFCSPLRRALETIELLRVEKYEIEASLIEMDWGEWEGQVLKQLRRKLGDEMRSNEARGLDFCPPGGESPRQVQLRLQAWLEREAHLNQDIAVVAHKGIIRCFYALARRWDMCGESPVDFAWDAAHLFEFDENGRLGDSYESIPLEQTVSSVPSQHQ